MEVGQESHRVCGLDSALSNIVLDYLQLNLQRLHPADLGHGNPGQHDDHGHLQRKLKQVGDQHSPESADECVNTGEGNQDEDADQ